jgi:hypothetical protein
MNKELIERIHERLDEANESAEDVKEKIELWKRICFKELKREDIVILLDYTTGSWERLQ